MGQRGWRKLADLPLEGKGRVGSGFVAGCCFLFLVLFLVVAELRPKEQST